MSAIVFQWYSFMVRNPLSVLLQVIAGEPARVSVYPRDSSGNTFGSGGLKLRMRHSEIDEVTEDCARKRR